MALPISVQLYSVRDYIAKDGFAPVLKRIADIGYVGVEPARYIMANNITLEQFMLLYDWDILYVPGVN